MNFQKIYRENTSPKLQEQGGLNPTEVAMELEAKKQQREVWLSRPNTQELLTYLERLIDEAISDNIICLTSFDQSQSRIHSNLVIQKTLERIITYARSGSSSK